MSPRRPSKRSISTRGSSPPHRARAPAAGGNCSQDTRQPPLGLIARRLLLHGYAELSALHPRPPPDHRRVGRDHALPLPNRRHPVRRDNRDDINRWSSTTLAWVGLTPTLSARESVSLDDLRVGPPSPKHERYSAADGVVTMGDNDLGGQDSGSCSGRSWRSARSRRRRETPSNPEVARQPGDLPPRARDNCRCSVVLFSSIAVVREPGGHDRAGDRGGDRILRGLIPVAKRVAICPEMRLGAAKCSVAAPGETRRFVLQAV